MASLRPTLADPTLPADILAEMERMNEEAAPLHIWLRTHANAPQRRPWDDGAREPVPEPGRGKAVPHLWRWAEISPYLHRIAEIAPLEFTDRQQFLLMNPGFGGGLKIANAIRIAVSIYKAGDVAETHVHTPNASRTILSEAGGYTLVGNERCEAKRGDLILTPNGSWHGHGNDSGEPVIWMDTLDWPLLEFLDAIWIRPDDGRGRANRGPDQTGLSQRLYGAGGMMPRLRDVADDQPQMIHYRGTDVLTTLAGLKDLDGSPYDGIYVDFVDPVTARAPIPTLGYSAQLLRAGEETRPVRETCSTVFTAMQGSGWTEVNGTRLEWSENDIFVVPGHMWRHHGNVDPHGDAVLYAVSDAPLLKAIGQYRRQGQAKDGAVVELEG